MYAMFKIIYGIPLISNDDDKYPEGRLEEAIEDEDDGFISYYSGASDGKPAAFGVEVSSFDECFAFMNANEMQELLKPMPQHIQEFEDNWSALDQEMQKLITEFGGVPRVFILSATS